MKTTNSLMLVLFTSSLASAACIVESVDTDNTGGSGASVSTGGTGAGGDATGGGAEGGGGGTGGTSEGGAGVGGGGGEGGAGPDCFDTCNTMYPNGVDTYFGYLSCVTCSACYDICDGGSGDVCLQGSELGCSANAPDCETCVNGACASDVDGNGATSGVCATELDDLLNNQDALSLNDCYNACPE
jgi:hypothetical protein